MEVQTMPFAQAEAWLKENTHGHVVPNSLNLQSPCMGPAECPTCKVEQQLKTLIDADRKAFEQATQRMTTASTDSKAAKPRKPLDPDPAPNAG